jgi:hypothetical protein
MKAQENKREKEKKMISSKFNMGDKVVFEFVVDVPENEGIVVGLEGDKVQVEYKVLGKVYRDWLSMDEVELESNWVF